MQRRQRWEELAGDLAHEVVHEARPRASQVLADCLPALREDRRDVLDAQGLMPKRSHQQVGRGVQVSAHLVCRLSAHMWSAHGGGRVGRGLAGGGETFAGALPRKVCTETCIRHDSGHRNVNVTPHVAGERNGPALSLLERPTRKGQSERPRRRFNSTTAILCCRLADRPNHRFHDYSAAEFGPSYSFDP